MTKAPFEGTALDFRWMVDGVRDYAIFMLDPQGRVASWNVGAERLKGYTSSEIVGKHLSIFYTEPDKLRAHPDAELRLALAEGRYGEEGWRVRKDGSQFWASVVITAIFDDTGKHLGFTKVTRDFTERRAAEEILRQSEERFRLLVESVTDYAIFMLAPDGRISSWNTGAERITGYGREEIVGQHFSIFYPPELATSGRPAEELAVARTVGRFEEEGWRVRKNGERFWANVVLTPVYDEAHVLRGFAKITRDLTERHKMEREAREAERRAQDEQARAREAELAVSLRDDFISIAAHELRTPLTALHLKLQGMRLAGPAWKHASDAERLVALNERLVGAGRQASRLTALVERLLDTSRIVGGRLRLEKADVELSALVRRVVGDLGEPSLGGRLPIELDLEASVVGHWDEARLEQVVLNLLSNAIKYGEGTPIAVQVRGTPETAVLRVSDRGRGILPEDVERIFQRFERAAPPEAMSLGMGLYIARNIVAAHAGTIRVDSELGQGAAFVVELPRRAETRA